MDDMIRKLQDVLDSYTASGEETGCQLTVYRHGKHICSLVSGYADAARTKKVTEKTLFPIFSVGKGIVTTLFHILAEQGVVDPDAPVAKYWPEYAVNGKENTLVWHILTHRAGVYQYPADFAFTDWFCKEKAIPLLEKMAPLDKIGGIRHYHAHTFGILVGHLLEKAANRPMNDLLREKILDPLGIQDFFYGTPDDRYNDVAELTPYTTPDGKVHTENSCLAFYDRRVLQGWNPSSNGTATAHAVARIYASLIEDGVDGVKLLKDETLRNALILRRSEDDTPPGSECDKFGLGYVLCGPEAPWNRMFGHGGAAGSEGVADRESGYAIGFTKNQLSATHPDHHVRRGINEVLGIPNRIW